MKHVEIKGLRTTIYKVDDLTKAKEWYANAFGVTPYFDEPFYAGFSIGGYELGLIPEKTESPRTTNVLSYWGVDDITDSYDKMVSAGAKELETPVDVGGGIKVALVKDPWQNVIGLIYNPSFKLAYPKYTVLEWASFTLKEAVSPEKLRQAAKQLDVEFLSRQPGFIQRELLHKSERQYVDMIFWESEDLAKKAMANAETSNACTEYFSIMEVPDNQDPNSLIQHFELVHY